MSCLRRLQYRDSLTVRNSNRIICCFFGRLEGWGRGVKARFEVLTAMLLKIQSVWDVMAVPSVGLTCFERS